jgi:hypothetical protein
LGKIGPKADIILSLCNSYCLPVLLYGIEVISLTKTEKKRLASTFNRLFAKLFFSFNPEFIAECQYYMSYLPLEYVIDLRTLNFLFKCQNHDNTVIRAVFRLKGPQSLNDLCTSYGLNIAHYKCWKRNMWEHFENEHGLDCSIS